MKRRTRVPDDPSVELTPMIDVTFLLLVFFLLTLRFKTLEGKLETYLPKDAGASERSAEPLLPVELTVHVPAARTGQRVYAAGPDRGARWQGESDRRYAFVGRAPVYQLGPRRTDDLEEFGRWLAARHASTPDAPVLLEARAGTVYGDVVPVLDLAAAVGFASLRFSGDPR